jgi:hypothetical protein
MVGKKFNRVPYIEGLMLIHPSGKYLTFAKDPRFRVSENDALCQSPCFNHENQAL